MNPPKYAVSADVERTDHHWLASIRGQLGADVQQEALQDLARYLHVVAYNYLHRCRANSVTLTSLANSEIAKLAEDYVCAFLEKLVSDEFALLEKYNQRGRFTAWAAAVLINLMASEMRKSSWRKQVPLAATVSIQKVDELTPQPEEAAMQNSILALLQCGIDEMPMRYQVVLTRCLLEGEAAKDVAELLDTTPNAVNILVHRAKKNMRKYLTAHDVDKSVIYLFV